MKSLITLILTLFLFVGCSSDSEVIPPIMTYDYSTTELELINKVNDYRTTNGLSTLQPVDHIGYLCSEHNQNMINTTVGHQDFESRINNLKLTMDATRVSELVASNYISNQSVMSAFLNDPLCKKILDEQDRNRIGVAVSISPTGRKYYTLIIIN